MGMAGRSFGSIDVHQHLWPDLLVEALRRRTDPPRLDGWTLHLAGEPPFPVDPEAHDAERRAAAEPADRELALVSLSSPLGIEALPPDEAVPLLDAWHVGAAALSAPFRAWAAAHAAEPDLEGLHRLLLGTFVGIQVPATAMGTPRRLEQLAPTLELCERLERPVLVHPGPARTDADEGVPPWWPALVPYVAQLHAAWWSWHTAGRALFPRLRICFAAGAGLAPVQHERLRARGGRLGPVDADVFVDTSSHGPQALDALTRVLGVDALVLGSDRPYAEPLDPCDLRMGAAAAHAIHVINPHRLLEGGRQP